MLPAVKTLRAPLGDRIVISDSEIDVRSFAYLHPVLIIALPILLVLGVSSGLVGSLLDLFVAGLIIIPVTYGFLAGEGQFVIRKSYLPAGAGLDPAFDRTERWLSLELPMSLRTRLVIASFPSPVVLLFLALNLPRLAYWLRTDAYTLEVVRRLGKLNSTDRVGLVTAFRLDPDGQLLPRIRTLRWLNKDIGTRPGQTKRTASRRDVA
jgi:hypothetical protein